PLAGPRCTTPLHTLQRATLCAKDAGTLYSAPHWEHLPGRYSIEVSRGEVELALLRERCRSGRRGGRGVRRGEMRTRYGARAARPQLEEERGQEHDAEPDAEPEARAAVTLGAARMGAVEATALRAAHARPGELVGELDARAATRAMGSHRTIRAGGSGA